MDLGAFRKGLKTQWKESILALKQALIGASLGLLCSP